MVKYWKYLVYVARHKWYVGVECLRQGLWLRALTHDWSKLRWSEFKAYTEWFYGDYGLDSFVGSMKGSLRKEAYDIAWLKHQHRNSHHWQHWILRMDDEGTHTLQMSEKDAIEMVCDWIGMKKMFGDKKVARTSAECKNQATNWFIAHKNNIILHPSTRAQVRRLLDITNRQNSKCAEKVEPTTDAKSDMTVDEALDNCALAIKNEIDDMIINDIAEEAKINNVICDTMSDYTEGNTVEPAGECITTDEAEKQYDELAIQEKEGSNGQV